MHHSKRSWWPVSSSSDSQTWFLTSQILPHCRTQLSEGNAYITFCVINSVTDTCSTYTLEWHIDFVHVCTRDHIMIPRWYSTTGLIQPIIKHQSCRIQQVSTKPAKIMMDMCSKIGYTNSTVGWKTPITSLWPAKLTVHDWLSLNDISQPVWSLLAVYDIILHLNWSCQLL